MVVLLPGLPLEFLFQISALFDIGLLGFQIFMILVNGCVSEPLLGISQYIYMTKFYFLDFIGAVICKPSICRIMAFPVSSVMGSVVCTVVKWLFSCLFMSVMLASWLRLRSAQYYSKYCGLSYRLDLLRVFF